MTTNSFQLQKEYHGFIQFYWKNGISNGHPTQEGVLKERVYKSGGLYGSAIDEIVKWLTKAQGVAENKVPGHLKVFRLPFIFPIEGFIEDRIEAEIHRAHIERGHFRRGPERAGAAFLKGHAMATTGCNIDGLKTEEIDANIYFIDVALTIRNRKHLADVIRHIRKMPDVQRVTRLRK